MVTRSYCRPGSICLIALAAAVGGMVALAAQQGTPARGAWRYYAGDNGATRYAPLDQITRDNVKNLNVAWTWKSDAIGTPPEIRNQSTPLMVNGTLYLPAGSHRSVVALDAGTGQQKWVWSIDEGVRWEKSPRRNSGRGVAYWTDGRGDERIFTITPGFQLVALNAKSGQQVAAFGQAGIVDLFKEMDPGPDPLGIVGNSSPPVVCRDVVIVGPAFAEMSRPRSKLMPKGDVMAFDVRTGKKRWVFHTIPRPGEFGADTWLKNSGEFTGNTAVWTTFSADDQLGYVYLPVESPTGDYYGGQRPGHNLFGSTLVAVEAATGKRVWHYQLIHHDIWDYDIGVTPVLMDLKVDGKPVKAVVQATKQAFVYVLDRTTGKPVWPIEERPVPQSDAPGEWTSPTQPFPTRPPAFDRQGIAVDDLVDWTPELRQKAIEALKPYRYGPLYTPGSLAEAPDGTKGTLYLPGNVGGAVWESTAADPETGYFYVSSITRPTRIALVKPTAAESDLPLIGLALNPPQPDIEGLPYLKPPYGRITAYDMNKGEIVWQKANGDTPPEIKNHPKLQGLNIPRTGGVWRSSFAVTKTLLFAAEGWTGPGMFRAMDKATGDILWETKLPVGSNSGLPMTYMHNGKQYVVVIAADQEARIPAQVIAYALPDRTPSSVPNPPARQTTTAAPAPDATRIAAGRRLFADNCGNEHCHGGSASAMQDHSDLTAARLRHVIEDGVPEVGMQGFKGVYSSEELDALIAYVLSIAKPTPSHPVK